MRSLIFALALLCVPAVAEDWTPLTNLVPVAEPQKAGVQLVRVTSGVGIPDAVRQASRSVCRVRVAGSGNSVYMGSGTYVGARTIVTAKHVLRDGRLATTTAEFSGRSFSASGWLANAVADQYLIELTEDPPVNPVPLAQVAPSPGEIVYVVGFGGDGFAIWPARFASTGSSISDQDSGFYAGRNARQGDSGGAVFNDRGEYVGTIWGGGGASAVAVTYTHTRAFFQRTGLLARIFGRRNVAGFEQQSCTLIGGSCRSPGIANSPQMQPRVVPRPPVNYGSVPTPSYFGDSQLDVPPQVSQSGCQCQSQAGPQGETGPQGPQGSQGPQGPPGPGITASDIDAITQRVAASIQIPNQRVVLVDGSSGTVIDDETYQPGEPIVLDFQRVINAAKRRQ